MTELLFFGELLLRLTAPGHERLLQSPRLDVYLGGAEANVAVGLSQLGHSCHMLSVLPDSELAGFARAELMRYGVDIRNVRHGDGRMGLYFLSPASMMRAPEVHYDRAESAFARLKAADFDWPKLLEDKDALHLSGISAALGPECALASQQAAQAASAKGAMVGFDCNYRAKLWAAWNGNPAQSLKAIAEHSSVLFAGAADIDLLLGPAATGAEPAQQFNAAAARAFAAFPRLQLMCSTLRITHSAHRHSLSALLQTRAGEQVQTPFYELEGIVDSIGTGDAFAVGIWHGVLQQLPPARIAELGWTAACLKHSVPGDLCLIQARELEEGLGTAFGGVRR